MLQCCAKVMRYTHGFSQDQFFSNELVYDAVLRNLELLGEAAKQIPIEVQQRHPIVPWRRIAGLRDVLAHAYFGLEEDTIWQTIGHSIPALAEQLDAVASMELPDQK
ncbi:MAG: DUF86 domain-containing protein [Cyanobacteriota bacterium]